jgi:hypothetical protein
MRAIPSVLFDHLYNPIDLSMSNSEHPKEPDPASKDSAYSAVGLTSLIGALILKPPAIWSGVTIGSLIGTGLFLAIVGGIAVVSSNPENAKRNGIVCTALVITLAFVGSNS